MGRGGVSRTSWGESSARWGNGPGSWIHSRLTLLLCGPLEHEIIRLRGKINLAYNLIPVRGTSLPLKPRLLPWVLPPFLLATPMHPLSKEARELGETLGCSSLTSHSCPTHSFLPLCWAPPMSQELCWLQGTHGNRARSCPRAHGWVL